MKDGELIIFKDGAALLDPKVSRKIAEFEKKIKEMKNREEELKLLILKEMEKKNVIKLETQDMTVSYIAGTDRETFNSKKFKTDHAELYDSYVEMKPVNPSIRIRLKGVN